MNRDKHYASFSKKKMSACRYYACESVPNQIYKKIKSALSKSNLSEKIELVRLPFHQHTHILSVSHTGTRTKTNL